MLTLRSVKEIIERFGGIPKWPTGADCKSAGIAFVGSNPTPSTSSNFEPLAQLVEHLTFNQGVEGSRWFAVVVELADTLS
jgi:hypothetical protein